MINDLAQNIGMDMICYVNPVTLETIAFPKNILEEIGWEDDLEEDEDEDEVLFSEYDLFRKDLKRIHTEWEKFITVEPPESGEAFRFMEQFVHTVADARLKSALSNALQRLKPFRNFNAIVHQSSARKAWFEFRQRGAWNTMWPGWS